MARINLLPWRELKRKEDQRKYLSIIVFCVIVTGILVLLVHINFKGEINYQMSRNRYLENEIKILDGKIQEIVKLEATRKALLERMEVIQNLQATRPGVVHLFDQLVATLPDGTYLTSVKQTDDSLTIKGKAESNARVSAYMRNIENSDWLADPTLEVIQTKETGPIRTSEFDLLAKQVYPSDKPEAKSQE